MLTGKFADLSPHPDWLAIGSEVQVVRRFFHSIAWREDVTVVRHTKTLVIVRTKSGEEWRFKSSRWDGYYLTPKYLDYITELVKKEEQR